MKYLIVCSFLIFMSVMSCTVQDLTHVVDQYDAILRLADLARAVMDDDFSVDWESLQRLQVRYDVNLIEPTTNFLMSASNLRAAYKELQQKIENDEYLVTSDQELSRALKTINESK